MNDYAQLPLNIRVREEQTFDTFIVGDNQHVVTALKNQAAGGERLIYLLGKDSGISHLIQAACNWAGEHNRSAVYLPLDALMEYGESVLEGVESVDLICLDHLPAIVGDPQWEEALFHLFNKAEQNHCAMLIGAEQRPSDLGLGLADLESRLALCTLFKLTSLSDNEKSQLLKSKASRQGLMLSDEVTQYILSRGDRQLKSLLQVLDQLDKHALSAGKKLTIPFIKKVLNW